MGSKDPTSLSSKAPGVRHLPDSHGRPVSGAKYSQVQIAARHTQCPPVEVTLTREQCLEIPRPPLCADAVKGGQRTARQPGQTRLLQGLHALLRLTRARQLKEDPAEVARLYSELRQLGPKEVTGLTYSRNSEANGRTSAAPALFAKPCTSGELVCNRVPHDVF